jgi:membrane-bound lytic murein transglycosylase D
MELRGALPKTHTRQRKWVRANPVWISEIMQRSTDYLPFIARAIDERRLPAELALIPAVESGFEASARSQEGADGLWQFMPNTARGYGLKRTWWYEGRRDTIAATDAALRYLAALNKRFKGNWLLAIAAYNCGASTVNRALRRSGLNAENARIWDILKELPKETQKYVPRVLAIAEAVQNPTRFGLVLPPADMSPRFAAVDTGGQIDLQRVASLAKIDLDVLSELNPAYRRWATDPAGPHRLLVPPHLADEVQASLSQLQPDQRVSWNRHMIRGGESLSVIAKRYGVGVSALKTANKLTSTRIRAGSNLLIPLTKGAPPHGPHTSSTDRKRSGASSAQRPTTRVANGISDHTDSSRDAGETNSPLATDLYEIRRGDSLWVIARRHFTTVTRLVRLNGLTTTSTLQPGQRLKVPLRN